MQTEIEQGVIVSVDVDLAGSTLTAAADIGAEELTLDTLLDFEEDGGFLVLPGGSVAAYTAFDEELGPFLPLAAPLVAALAEGDFIAIYPDGVPDKWAQVAIDSEEDATPIDVAVPHFLKDRVPEGVREPGTREEVVIGWNEVQEWHIVDVLGVQPKIGAEFVDPTEQPVSDGLPPASSPAPTSVTGGPGFLAIRWEPIENADPVTYDVHISTGPGFTPSAASLVGSTPGALLFLRDDAVGEALEYDVDYYIRIVARDFDGQAPPGTEDGGQLAQINSDDIIANAVLANHIAAGEVLASKLAAEIVLSTLFRTGIEGEQRVEFDAGGIRAYLQGIENELRVNIPTSPDQPITFNGEFIAQALEVLSMRLRSADNVMEPGSALQLAAGVQPPANSPSVALTWDQIALGTTMTPTGLRYDAAGGAGGATATFLTSSPTFGISEFAADGSGLVRSGAQGDSLWGITRIGAFVYVLRKSLAGQDVRWFVDQYAQSDLDTVVASTNVTDRANVAHPGLGTDGTNLVLVARSGSRIRLVTYSAVTLGFLTVDDLDPAYEIDADSRLRGYVRFTEDAIPLHWISVETDASGGDGVQAFNIATGVRSATRRFLGYGGVLGSAPTPAYGLTHDGTRFVSGRQGASSLTGHSNWRWGGESSIYWIGYTWRDGDGTTHETTISPRAKVTMQKRAFMRVSTGPISDHGDPDDPDRIRIYANRGDTEPQGGDPVRYAGLAQATGAVGVTTVVLSDFDAAGTPPENPGAGDFPGATPAEIRSQDGEPLLRANGYPRCRLRGTSALTIGNNALTPIAWNLEDADTDGFFDAETNNIQILLPYDGQYLVVGSASFAPNSTGQRRLILEKSEQGGVFAAIGNALAPSGPGGGENSGACFSDVVDALAGDRVRFRAWQNSGGPLGVPTRRCAVLYLGPE